MRPTVSCTHCLMPIADCRLGWHNKKFIAIIIRDAPKWGEPDKLYVSNYCEKKSCELLLSRLRPESKVDFNVVDSVEQENKKTGDYSIFGDTDRSDSL